MVLSHCTLGSTKIQFSFTLWRYSMKPNRLEARLKTLTESEVEEKVIIRISGCTWSSGSLLSTWLEQRITPAFHCQSEILDNLGLELAGLETRRNLLPTSSSRPCWGWGWPPEAILDLLNITLFLLFDDTLFLQSAIAKLTHFMSAKLPRVSVYLHGLSTQSTVVLLSNFEFLVHFDVMLDFPRVETTVDFAELGFHPSYIML